MKKVFLFVVLLIVIVFTAGCTQQNKQPQPKTNETSQAKKNGQDTYEKSNVPTVYFHGYGGTYQSLGGMIDRLEKQEITKREMVIRVAVDGRLSIDGALSSQNNNPSIQVLFDDNQNNEWNQAEWIHNVFTYLKTQGVSQINVVTHSMGGVSLVRSLATYGQTDEVVTINKFASIAAPYNNFLDTSSQQTVKELLRNGPAEESDRYIFYRDHLDNIPTNINIKMIAGKLDKQTFTDGTVPTTSALALFSLLKAHNDTVSYEVFTGANAQHSRLHENPKVDQSVAKFLWGIKAS
ncbi:alpha/beta hydrolase [Enterococcus sp. AZ103]|uniref:alpha/beta hydrolase n=1 Tax=Enterococcus sp. AZ103 TaxID=2774628 RepID=UPI003F224A6D